MPAQIPVGVYPSYPPLDMPDPATGALSGFDVELGQQLVKRLNTRFDMQETAFAQLVASVQTGRKWNLPASSAVPRVTINGEPSP